MTNFPLPSFFHVTGLDPWLNPASRKHNIVKLGYIKGRFLYVGQGDHRAKYYMYFRTTENTLSIRLLGKDGGDIVSM